MKSDESAWEPIVVPDFIDTDVLPTAFAIDPDGWHCFVDVRCH